ncbi:MAG: tRNA (adenosine(37)-N6)-threonylcarbamoyltransferase complex ATPase subunit type 1 TsaE [Candidatus Omnitrophica bacterium CG11_big_fil_rev_8_21_14_0_20_42_13]|uniref:tRNA threonylcarbamoyladenosine biosynthesis protein TsaE n=1 Tax=Candidatus Ghiorseimicrobium undicola TaxID=1974746 RepID=A0A2H0LZL5_9BACT|nr:MAG: tRNA (adenosine(37)-N6)-threonylcarbamoyltransferase complex ATPase subunit type 1 TsaE [Candidatus Omnitrophica bacterium CG11_big_fil_rev_8_21_14_0_20_42_13]
MRIITKNSEETKEFGRKLAKKLKPCSVIALFGGLGSGKTVLTKGIADGLGIKKAAVISPTFVLLREYASGKVKLYHFDLYRIKKTDILSLGIDEYLYGDGISVVEWAERIEDYLPRDCMKIEISVLGENKRLINVKMRQIKSQAR